MSSTLTGTVSIQKDRLVFVAQSGGVIVTFNGNFSPPIREVINQAVGTLYYNDLFHLRGQHDFEGYIGPAIELKFSQFGVDNGLRLYARTGRATRTQIGGIGNGTAV